MKLSLSEYALLFSMAVSLAAVPNSVVAFVPTCQNGQFRHVNGKGVSPSITTKLNYIDADKVEIESLMDSRSARRPTNEAVERWKNKVSRQVSLLVGRLTTFLVSRLAKVLHLLKKRTMDTTTSVGTVKADETASTEMPLDKESPMPKSMNGATVFDSDRTNTAATIKVDTAKANGWSLPTLDHAKDEVTENGQDGTLAVSPEVLVVSEMVVDVEPTTRKSTRKDPANLFFAHSVTSESVVRESQVDESQSRESVAPLFQTFVKSSAIEEELASRDAESLFSRMDWSQAPGTVVQAMEVARGAYKFGSLLTTATTAACGSAFAMAREYAANVALSKSQVPPFVPSPPKFPPSASVFDIQSIQHELLSSSKVPFISTFNIDFEAIDMVLMEAESALKVVEELVASSSSSSSSKQISNEKGEKESRSMSSSSSPSIGTNMAFSEMDDILMQAESALQLAEASLSKSDAVQSSTTNEKKKEASSTSSSSIGTNIDFSEIDQILMQAESALQLVEASSCM